MAAMLCRHRPWLLAGVMTCLLTTIAAQVSTDCPLGWELYSGHCYNFVFYPALRYTSAATACQNDGAYLVSVNTNEEHDWVSGWLTRHDMDRSSRWWTSGIGAGQQLHWDGDGTAAMLDQAGKWVSQQGQQSANQRVVYHFTTLTNTFLWSRQAEEVASPYICEISLAEAFRISQAQRDHTYGTDQSDVELVPRGPKFVIEPQSVVVVGRLNSGFLECSADSNPPATYTWYKVTNSGTVTITAGTNDRYSLTNGRFSFQEPERSDAGDYYCQASNDLGTIRSHVVTVSFGFLGEFSNDPPGAVRADQYQGTYLECNTPLYNPDVSYQWYRSPGAKFVRTDLNPHQFISYNGRLYFSETQQADAGMYHCVVTLTAPVGQAVATAQPPSATSLGIELIIRGDTATEFGPTIHNDFPAVFPAPSLRGQDLRIECLAYGKLPLYYKWRRDNGPIPDKALYQESGRVLVIQDAQLEDSGNYTCRVERGTRASDEKTLSLMVEAVPFFVFPLRDQHVNVGSTFSIHCEAMAVPLPTYAWFKDGQTLTSTPDDVEVRGNVVTFTSADPERHDGMYECSASNLYGTRRTAAEVRVLEFKPSFSKRPLDPSQMATVGGNSTIICQPEAAPQPTITWYHGGRDLGLSPGGEGRVMMLDNGNLLLTQVQMSDQGEYRCTAENDLGSASSNGLLTVVERTTITVPPSNTDVQLNNSAFLGCQASYDQRNHDLSYIWAFNGYTIDVDYDPHYQRSQRNGIHGLYVVNAQFRHEGWYECNAVTVDDKASASAYLLVKGPPSESAGLYGRVEGNDVILKWTRGSDHGSNIIFYSIELMSNFFPEWRVKVSQARAADTSDSEFPEKSSYRITDLSPGSSYSFRVRAINSFGVGDSSVASEMFKVPDAPPVLAPDGIENYISTVGTLSFSWMPLNPEDLTGERKGYKLFWRKKTPTTARESLWETATVDWSENTFVAVVGVDNYYLPYEVMVAAFNSLGPGPNSSVTIVMSQEDLPIATPMNVNGEEFNATAIMVYWDPVDNTREIMRGKLWGFQINYWWETDPSYQLSMNVYCDDCTEGMVLGLSENDDYWVNVQVFNTAGLGPKGEDYRISTLLFPPQRYPEFVSVYSMEGSNVYVTWRGVFIALDEEPLAGYKLHWWPATANSLKANVTVIESKQTWGVIEGVKEGIVYALRVLGYNAGGDGKKSPTVYFTLEGQVLIYNLETTEIMAAGSYVTASLWVLIASCLGQRLLL